jgi:hypothetical protein
VVLTARELELESTPFQHRPRAKPKARSPERGFMISVIIDSVHIRRGGKPACDQYSVACRSTCLHGARKDSAIQANVWRNRDTEVRHTAEGPTQTLPMEQRVMLRYRSGSIADPDSAGIKVVVDTLTVLESTPAIPLSQHATVARAYDSARFVSLHWGPSALDRIGRGEGGVGQRPARDTRGARHGRSSAQFVDLG